MSKEQEVIGLWRYWVISTWGKDCNRRQILKLDCNSYRSGIRCSVFGIRYSLEGVGGWRRWERSYGVMALRSYGEKGLSSPDPAGWALFWLIGQFGAGPPPPGQWSPGWALGFEGDMGRLFGVRNSVFASCACLISVDRFEPKLLGPALLLSKEKGRAQTMVSSNQDHVWIRTSARRRIVRG